VARDAASTGGGHRLEREVFVVARMASRWSRIVVPLDCPSCRAGTSAPPPPTGAQIASKSVARTTCTCRQPNQAYTLRTQQVDYIGRIHAQNTIT
jgi:hypothetical protein